MSLGLGMILILGLLANSLFTRLRLPGIIGMLLLGIGIGPWGVNLIPAELMSISGELRRLALIVILLRAGLGLDKNTLKEVGPTALKLSFIPCLMEGFAIAFISMSLLGFNFIEGAVLGFVIAAVSPAVVVPRMLHFSEKGLGADKGIPTLILAGSSVDDIFAITMLSSFLALYTGGSVSPLRQGFGVLSSAAAGIIAGIICAYILIRVFRRFSMRDTKKVLYIMGTAIILTSLEEILRGRFRIAGLLGVMTVGFIFLEKIPDTAKRVANKFGKIWIPAEIILFVLVGAQVNIEVAFDAGAAGIIIIFAGLFFRSIGVMISTIGGKLNMGERLFCVISYIPKATVQAAIGALPLSMGVAGGEIILAIAVLSIIITAPLGAFGINYSAEKLLSKS